MSRMQTYLIDAPRAPKALSTTSISPTTAEEWLKQFPHKRAENRPNGGIIRSIASRNHLIGGNLSPDERKERVKQSQKDFKKAVANLQKQDAIDAVAIKKQRDIWRAEEEATKKAQADKVIAKKAASKAKRDAKKLASKDTLALAQKQKEADDVKEFAGLQEISNLVDALDALKYLTLKKKLKAYRLPMCTPDVVLDAVYREFNRVQRDQA